METVKIRDEYKITQVSRGNSEFWTKLRELASEFKGETLLDFEDVNLDSPWLNNEFKLLLANPYVHIKLYSSSKEQRTIELACIMAKYKPGRIHNEDIVVEDYISPEDRVMLSTADNYKQRIEIVKEDGEPCGVLRIYEIVSQIGTPRTVKSIERAIIDHSGEENLFRYRLETEMMFIQENIKRSLAQLVRSMQLNKIELNIKSEDKETDRFMVTHGYIAGTEEWSQERKAEEFNKYIKPNTVGLLSKYKETRSKDSFGRRGNGEAVSCRPAIYLGMEKSRHGDITAVIREYDVENFFTAMQYQLDNDGEEHPGLTSRLIKIPMIELGACRLFVGRSYHFDMPMQCFKEDYITVYKYDGDVNKMKTVKMTVPQHFKLVLDDAGVKYDSMALMDCIADTFKYLEENDEK